MPGYFETKHGELGREADRVIARLGGGTVPPPEPVDWDVHAWHSQLLSTAYGYATSDRDEPLTGGSGGLVRVVTQTDGTDLRQFLGENGPRIILFEKDLDGQRIRKEGSGWQTFLKVGPDKTVAAMSPDGDVLDITISVDEKNGGLKFGDNSQNVIIRGLNGESSSGVWCETGIGSKRIWFDGCELQACGINTYSEETSITHSTFVGAQLAHSCPLGRCTMSQNQYTACDAVLRGGDSSTHFDSCRIEYTSSVAMIAKRRLYLTRNVFSWTGDGPHTALELESRALWGGYGNAFDGADFPTVNYRVAVPYPV